MALKRTNPAPSRQSATASVSQAVLAAEATDPVVGKAKRGVSKASGEVVAVPKTPGAQKDAPPPVAAKAKPRARRAAAPTAKVPAVAATIAGDAEAPVAAMMAPEAPKSRRRSAKKAEQPVATVAAPPAETASPSAEVVASTPVAVVASVPVDVVASAPAEVVASEAVLEGVVGSGSTAADDAVLQVAVVASPVEPEAPPTVRTVADALVAAAGAASTTAAGPGLARATHGHAPLASLAFRNAQPSGRGSSMLSRDDRHRMIQSIAYGYAERAGFSNDPFQDWLAAERDVDRMFQRAAG